MAYKGVPTIRKRLVGKQLRRLRESRGISVEDVASRLGIGPSALRRLESGHTAASVADVMAFMEIYEVEDQEVRQRLTDLARSSRVRGWWAAYGNSVGPAAIDLADAEDLATELRSFQPLLVPGIMQTRAYTKTMADLGAGLDERSWDVEKVAAVREQRKALLEREKPPRVWAVIGESALRTSVGGPEVMAEQVDHLMTLAERNNISLQLLPFEAGAHLGSAGSFLLLNFAGSSTAEGSIMHLESAEAFNDDPAQIRLNMAVFSSLQAQALSTGDTQRYFHQSAKEWRERL